MLGIDSPHDDTKPISLEQMRAFVAARLQSHDSRPDAGRPHMPISDGAGTSLS
jgi:hypothetical protein